MVPGDAIPTNRTVFVLDLRLAIQIVQLQGRFNANHDGDRIQEGVESTAAEAAAVAAAAAGSNRLHHKQPLIILQKWVVPEEARAMRTNKVARPDGSTLVDRASSLYTYPATCSNRQQQVGGEPGVPPTLQSTAAARQQHERHAIRIAGELVETKLEGSLMLVGTSVGTTCRNRTSNTQSFNHRLLSMDRVMAALACGGELSLSSCPKYRGVKAFVDTYLKKEDGA
uniref:Uncharacterized protein n=1 Tax=Setaria digitata TaxID=48799 RepID=A0A915Q2G1_9BILA